ncbi:biopolymer transporter ExbB [Pseudooceanicola sp.]|uniref:biopolymer transporter ExbB n=1 Tax=Pseudooceanicola sp. TaxID=1914328 RepID=UPI002621DAA1|nr:biopolymer transporter ExbB [Pseudooceanicola sp.]MDF1854481.1 biopolymer transporter ExbB [Pseudooceanicola sp.]
MDQPDREAQTQFSQPVRQIMLMLMALTLTGVGAVFAAPSVLPVFEANPYLNGFIAFVFGIGVIACFWQVVQLISSVRWIEAFAADRIESEGVRAPRLLAPLATLLRSRSRRMQISSTSATSILDSVATRIDEAREITRYIVNLLIFLGLLGTFYGLATTVPALVDTIRNLAPKDGEGGVEVFGRLMEGLDSQLGGMGVAFASSLLGLSGSLVTGLLELFASHGQNRFYRELEEWLSTITRVSFASGDAESGDSSGMAGAFDQMAEQMAEQMESLQTMFTQSDINRSMLDERIGGLTDAVTALAGEIGAQLEQNPVMESLQRVAEGQERLLDHLTRQGTGEGLDAESRMRLRSIDVQMLRILEEISAGRQETMTELRTDLAALAKAVQASSRRPGLATAAMRPAPVKQAGGGQEG